VLAQFANQIAAANAEGDVPVAEASARQADEDGLYWVRVEAQRDPGGRAEPARRGRPIRTAVATASGIDDNLIMPTETQQRAWMAQWSEARHALRAQRAVELQALSNERALAAADALLSIGPLAALPEGRRTFSGLVRQQALFRRQAAP